MDNEILTSLEQIKTLLAVILVIVAILLLGQISKLIARLLSKRTIYREKAFIHLAAKHYDNQEYEELVKYCEEKIKYWGNNPYPLYWLARAQYKLGDLTSSKELFIKVKDMELEWVTTVEPHLTKINEALTSASTPTGA